MQAAFGSIDVSAFGGVDDRTAFHAPQQSATGYDALENKGRRKAPPNRIVREDVLLQGGKRTRLQTNAQDLVRNFSVASWAIRQHMNYVSTFEFHSRTGDRGLDREIETLMEIQSRPNHFDRGGRCTRERGFRLAELRRVIDGDTGLLLLNDGTVQGIASDLIRNPEKEKIDPNSSHEWVDGVEVDFAGSARRYAIWARKKGGTGYEYRKNVSAANLILYGFFERWASEQTRGVSPIVAALNPLRDVYENFDYALIKAKIAQIFALAILRDEEAEPLDRQMPVNDDEATEETEEIEQPQREVNLGNGPQVLDLNKGDKVDTIESKNPSNELQAFSRLMLMVAMKALDLPYSFFDEGHTNYSGQRTSWIQYERSTKTAREDQAEMRRRWTVFQYRRWILDGLFVPPRGKTIGDLKFEWTALGMPWWKPSEEITGDLKAIASGLASPTRIVKERGQGDMYDNIDDLLEVLKYAHEQGKAIIGEPLRLNFDPGPFAAAITTDSQGAN